MKEVMVAPGPNPLENSNNPKNKVVGFWQGLWHGLIALVTLVMSLFKEDVGIYEVHNNGAWYNFGFVFSMMIIRGGSGVKKISTDDS